MWKLIAGIKRLIESKRMYFPKRFKKKKKKEVGEGICLRKRFHPGKVTPSFAINLLELIEDEDPWLRDQKLIPT